MQKSLRLSATARSLGIAFILGLSLFLLSWYLAIGGQVSNLESAIFRALNDAPFGPLFLIITFLGSIYYLLIVCTLLVIFKRFYWALQLFLAGFIAWAVAVLIKMAEIRERPYDLLSNVNLLEAQDVTAGFPSAHMALATAMAVTLFTKEKSHIYWLLIIALILLGVSRIVVGVHFPLDVIGGLGIGLMVGSVIKLIFLNYPLKKQNKKPHHN